MGEATVLILDNSEWMRNGDYIPSRLEAQQDSVPLICGGKFQSNPENACAIMTMAGKSPQLLATLTNDIGRVITVTHDISILGQAHFKTALQVAQLTLKHRLNKNQKQRIIAFVGSPIETSEDDLVALGRTLKKNDVAVDIVNFGELEGNSAKLEALMAVVDKDNNSHLVSVPSGPHILSELLVSSPIIQNEVMGQTESSDPSTTGPAAPGLGAFPFGALRESLQEEEARQQVLATAERAAAAEKSSQSGPSAELPSDASVAPELIPSFDGNDDEMLRRALEFSVQSAHEAMDVDQASTEHTASPAAVPTEEREMSEDDMLELALQLSCAKNLQPSSSSAAASSSQVAEVHSATSASSSPAASLNSSDSSNVSELGASTWIHDEEFVRRMLSELPGVDVNDPSIQDILHELGTRNNERSSDGGPDLGKEDTNDKQS